MLRAAVTQAEDALYCSLQTWDDPGLACFSWNSLFPQHFHMLRSGWGSPLFLLSHSCDSPLDCPLTESSSAAHYIQAPWKLVSNPILTLLKSCSFHGYNERHRILRSSKRNGFPCPSEMRGISSLPVTSVWIARDRGAESLRNTGSVLQPSPLTSWALQGHVLKIPQDLRSNQVKLG